MNSEGQNGVQSLRLLKMLRLEFVFYSEANDGEDLSLGMT